LAHYIRPVVIFVDVDDTFVRSYGTKRIPMPAVIHHIRSLFDQGAELYCWSSGGAEYARDSVLSLVWEIVSKPFFQSRISYSMIRKLVIGEDFFRFTPEAILSRH